MQMLDYLSHINLSLVLAEHMLCSRLRSVETEIATRSLDTMRNQLSQHNCFCYYSMADTIFSIQVWLFGKHTVKCLFYYTHLFSSAFYHVLLFGSWRCLALPCASTFPQSHFQQVFQNVLIAQSVQVHQQVGQNKLIKSVLYNIYLIMTALCFLCLLL